MQKTNQFRSSSFHMDEGDVLHMLIIEESGTFPTIDLVDITEEGVNAAVPSVPTASEATDIDGISFTANWYFNQNTSGFYLDVATDSAFTSFVAGYQNLNVGNVNSYSVGGLVALTDYYYRLRAYNEVGTSTSSSTITVTAEYAIPYMEIDSTFIIN